MTDQTKLDEDGNPPPFKGDGEAAARLVAMAQEPDFLTRLRLSANPRDWAAALTIERLRARVAELEARHEP